MTITPPNGSSPQNTPSVKRLKKFPLFPLEVISGLAKEFVDIYSPIREAPPEFFFGGFVVYFGNAISPYVRVEAVSSEPRLYLVNIGPSGASHKSSSIDAAKDFFKEHVKPNQHTISGIGSSEGILDELKKHQKPTVLQIDEMSTFAIKTAIQGTAGTAPFHQFFEGHTYDHTLADGKDRSVKDVHLSIIGASTDRDFISCWNGHHADTGWFSRLWLQASDGHSKPIAIAKIPDQQRLEQLGAKVRELIEKLKDEHPVYPIEPDASQMWTDYYNNADRYADEWNRCPTYACRFMALFAALEGTKSITREIVQKIIPLVDYQMAVRAALPPIVGDNPEAILQEMYRKAAPIGEWITKRKLFHKTNAVRRKGWSLATKALDGMISAGEFQTRTGRTKNSVELCRVDLESEVWSGVDHALGQENVAYNQ